MSGVLGDVALTGRIFARVGDLQLSRWIAAEAVERAGTAGAYEVAHELTERYLSGVPIQYLFGHWSFRSIELRCDPRALIPRPETEMLVELAKKFIAASGASKVIDIGTGTGAIALSLAFECSGLEITATDIDEEALELAGENRNGILGLRSNVRLVVSDLFVGLENWERFDLIVSNPPYVAEGSRLEDRVRVYEPHHALFAGPDGLDVIRRIISEAPAWLTSGGGLMIEIGELHGESVEELGDLAGFRSCTIERDLAGRNRFGILGI